VSPVISRQSSVQISAIERFVQECVVPFEQGLAQVESELSADAMPVRGDAIHLQVEALFDQSQAACREFTAAHKDDAELLAQARKLFLERTAPWFDQSWIAHRSRSKPSGFPGDFLMLVKLYEQTTPARGIGGYLDLCIQDLPLARAVRARLKCAREFLLDALRSRTGTVRVLDIASGPCREFENWPVLGHNTEVEIVAMDSDPAAIEYVQTHIAPRLPETTRLRSVRHNALRTRSAESTIRQFGRFDLIYSVGLCDYLTDEHLIAMFAAWRETLQEGGLLYIAFKDTLEYDHTPYQWHLDWYFYQRTQDDVLELYRAAGFDVDALEIRRDATGIITNYIYADQPSTIRRVDTAQAAEPRAPKTASVGTRISEDASESAELRQ
jgi:SAM-dependent methyltransferase